MKGKNIMNKFFLTTAIVFGLTGVAYAKASNAPAPIFNTDPNVYGAVVKDGQVIVRAPLGSDVQIDVDGTDLDVTVTGKDKTGFSKILPWNWNIWK